MTDTLLLAGFELDGDVTEIIPSDWRGIKPSETSELDWFLVHAVELKRAYLVRSRAIMRMGKRVSLSDLESISDASHQNLIYPSLKAAVARLSCWGVIEEYGIFNVPYHPSTIRFYEFKQPVKPSMISTFPSVNKLTLPSVKPAHLEVIPWLGSESFYLEPKNKFVVKQDCDDILVFGVSSDTGVVRPLTLEEQGKATEMGLTVKDCILGLKISD